MTERKRPDLNHVRGAFREEDERAAREGETAAPSQVPEKRTGSYGGVRYSLLHETAGLRTFTLILRHGDKVCETLLGFAREQQLSAASVTAIGAFSGATLGFFDWERKGYDRILVDEQVELLSLNGDISLAPDATPQLHLHVVLGKRDGTAHGGHLLEAEVRPTLEMVVTETPPDLRRRQDPESGLALIALADEADEAR
jgi:predicted DNA-binding protein with PD1-like motif